MRKGVELSPIENNARRSRRNGEGGRGGQRGTRRASAGGQGTGAGPIELTGMRGENEKERDRERETAGQGGDRAGGASGGAFYGEAPNSVPLRSITTSGVITELPTAR